MSGYRQGEALCLEGHGDILQGRGDSNGAERLYLKSREILRTIDLPKSELKLCYLLGKLKDSEGLPEWGEVFYQQALDIHKHTGIQTPSWLIERMKREFHNGNFP